MQINANSAVPVERHKPSAAAQALSEDDRRHLLTAWRRAEKSEYVRLDGKRLPKPEETAFAMLREALQVDHSLPDRERSFLRVRSQWAPFRRSEKAVDGCVSPVLFTPGQISACEVVLCFFPRLLKGRKQERDWKILALLAQGETESEVVRTLVDRGHGMLTPQAVGDRKRLQCGVIADVLERRLPGIKSKTCC
jgi:hypothetical protein